MRKVNKYLLGVFFILLVFVIGETFYYFYLQPSKKSSAPVNNDPSVSANPTINPRKKIIAQNNKAIYYFIPIMLGALTKDVVVSSKIINEYTGIVKTINREGGVLNGGLKYNVSLTIEGDLHIPLTFYYLPENLKVIKGLDNIKVGDKISIKETLDATKDFRTSRLEIIITKIYNKP